MGPVRRPAFTLVEMLTVISIVILIAGVSYPAIIRAREVAKITRSKSNMRQLHLAIHLYCGGVEGEGPNRLGLPNTFLEFVKTKNVPSELLMTGGSNWQSPNAPNIGYTWLVPNRDYFDNETAIAKGWISHLDRTNDNPILMVDPTYSLKFGQLQTKRVFGIYFDGHIETRHYKGIISNLRAWE